MYIYVYIHTHIDIHIFFQSRATYNDQIKSMFLSVNQNMRKQISVVIVIAFFIFLCLINERTDIIEMILNLNGSYHLPLERLKI